MILADVMTAAGPDVGAMVWDLVFWLFARTVIAVAIFIGLTGLGALLAALTEHDGWAVLGTILGLLAALAWEVYAVYSGFMSFLALGVVLWGWGS